jgi:hypothetical protein
MSDMHQSGLPPRPAFVERDAFTERNDVLFLMLGLVSLAERILSVVPELVEPPKPEASPAVPQSETAPSILR